MNTNLSRVNDLLSEKTIFAGTLVEQAPIHLDVPDERVAGARKCRGNPEIEERSVLTLICRQTEKNITRMFGFSAMHLILTIDQSGVWRDRNVEANRFSHCR